jgi:hypothetical protein
VVTTQVHLEQMVVVAAAVLRTHTLVITTVKQVVGVVMAV